jgi:hypothetical protein
MIAYLMDFCGKRKTITSPEVRAALQLIETSFMCGTWEPGAGLPVAAMRVVKPAHLGHCPCLAAPRAPQGRHGPRVRGSAPSAQLT